MKTKKILCIWLSGLMLCVLVVLALYGRQTLALLGASKQVVNAGTAGQISVEVVSQVDGLNQSAVSVVNTGTSDCYVRMVAVMPNENITGSGAASCLTAEINLEDWQIGGDGYYYYKEVLAPEETSKPLFRYINYHDIPASVSLEQLQVITYAEAVQSAYLDLGEVPSTRVEAQAAFARVKEK